MEELISALHELKNALYEESNKAMTDGNNAGCDIELMFGSYGKAEGLHLAARSIEELLESLVDE